MTDTDEAIAFRVQNGDRESFGVLVQRYESKMLRYARKFLSHTGDMQDVVQEVFLKAYINIQSFDTKRKFSSWLYRIAHNEFISLIRKNSRQPFFSFDADTIFPHPVAEETSDGLLKDKELKEALDSCLAKLSPKYRELLTLFYFEELSYQEIADILRVPVSTVGVRLKRGKDHLRKEYEKQNGKQ
ncbi:MAG: RNA polymerase sigma factor SigW [Candidatus Harrisonbacteria bacterium CG10_big_fil_rev_8_21_14_0_10_40_38]|uniref:RNA polymerase sigma factor SigW n=1 Tax=Candidatus Harrisonbacteria bacterium CG10_big_fil_rev_8_21_14_0_10_40_38 TaxID=1974583 RepID=A0A2H0UT76_9BACT|nr:MAG: RNA polymerase sigma factor SigW [Candidatus Harrisonbacteria bacterium CG10_big_fil_rev_8_21_14_0_10_40_38]